MNVEYMWTWKAKVLQKGCHDLENNSYVHTKQTIEGEEKSKQKKPQIASNITAFVQRNQPKNAVNLSMFFHSHWACSRPSLPGTSRSTWQYPLPKILKIKPKIG